MHEQGQGRGPNLFLIAAPRSASTQLATWLNTHPEISLADIKEPNYFARHELLAGEGGLRIRETNRINVRAYVRKKRRKRLHQAVFRDLETYLALFRTIADSRFRLDASTTYLACPEAPAAMAAAFPHALAISLRRDPVERALSHYRLAVSTGATARSLKDELQREINGINRLGNAFLLRPSRQEAGVGRVQDAFGAARHLPLTFAELTLRPEETLARIAAFLCVDAQGFDLSVLDRNPARTPRSGRLNHWIARTGYRGVVRQALPASVRRQLRRLFFRVEVRLPYDEDELALLKSLLADEYR